MRHNETLTAEQVDLQKDVICAYLVRESDLWLDARQHANRAEGLDAEANRKRDKSMKMINAMLDELIEVPGVRDEC